MAIPFNNVIQDALSGGPNIFSSTLAALGITPPVWGIFDQDGNNVITADTVISLEFKKDWTIADYPIERGAFESYDKVESPKEVRVGFFSGGNIQNRRRLLASVKAIAGDFKLYDVVTPEAIYTSVNVMHYDYRRVDGSAGWIALTIWLQEVRVTVESSLATAEPSQAATVSDGQVQTQPPTTQQQSIISKWVDGEQGTHGLIPGGI